MRRLSLLCLVLALACGGPTGPEPPEEPTGPPSLAIVSGDNQEVVVTDTLPFDAVVRVMRGGDPVPDQLVDWRVLEDNAGEPFVTTTRTDSTGTVKNRVIAGTRAFTHPDIDGPAHMEVRWIEQSSGDAIVDTTITFRVLPGVAESYSTSTSTVGECLADGDTLDIRDYVDGAIDQYGNPVPLREALDRPDSLVSWTWQERVQPSRILGPSGEGWTLIVDASDFVERGYQLAADAEVCVPEGEDEYATWIRVSVDGVDMERPNFRVPAP